MDADALRYILNVAGAVIGGLFAIAAALVGVLYWSLRGEDKRLAKNIHDLRDYFNRIVEPRLDKLERLINRKQK